jgi:hypothetical protein
MIPVGAKRVPEHEYVARAIQTMHEVDAMPAHLRRLVYDHGLLAVREGQAFAGENLDKLTGFLAKRRARRQAEALKVSISLL